MKKLKFSLVAILLMALISSCKKDEDETKPVYKLGPNVYEIDQPTSEVLVSVDSLKIDFTGNTQQLQTLKVGDIILSKIAPNAPYGFLRRITAIQKTGDDYTFTTEEVSLVEAFEELHIDYSQTFTPADTSIKKMEAALEFTINIPSIIVYDDDGDFDTEFDQIKLDGSVTYSPSLDLVIDISGFHLDYAKAGGSFTTTTDIQVTAGGSLASFDAEKAIYSQCMLSDQIGQNRAFCNVVFAC